MKRSLAFIIQLLLIVALQHVAALAVAQPVAAFSADTTKGCAPTLIRFRDESTGNPTSWRWDLGNGTISFVKNPAATYLDPGTYTVKLVATNASGSDSVVKLNYITIYATPVVNFAASSTTGCFPLTVQFTDLTTATNSTITEWLWDFGDGTTSTQQNPSHTYTALGNYNVSLKVKTNNGCENTLTRLNYIRINSGVTAAFNFTAPNSCRPPTVITFFNQSTGTGALTYQWDFGDGSTSSLTNPTYAYTTPGTYTVRLIVRNSSGCADTMTLVNAITIGTVLANFTAPVQVCAGQSFTITNTSSPAPSGAFWSFGDGSFSNAISPVKTYTTGGNYTIKLVSNFGACKDSVEKPITVLDQPLAEFTAINNKGCKVPATVNFTNTAVGATSYLWDFGDGNTSTAANPAHTYTSFGNYTVRLTVVNNLGCSATVVKNNFVQLLRPQVAIVNTPREGCVPYTYTPLINVLTGDAIVNYNWDFGDGFTSTDALPVHTYTNPGTYTIKLVYTTAGGCTDSTIVTNAIRVGQRPNPAFSANPRFACAFTPVSFTDLTTGPAVDRWFWRFGDGGVSTQPNPVYTYNDTGYFSVTLIVTSNGCTDSVTLNNYMYIKPPVARFYDSSSCSSKFTRWFRDQSIGATSWSWSFGDGNTSTQQNPAHTYGLPGMYTVTLTVRNDTCEHTFQRVVQIVSELANFSATDTVICKGTPVTFNTINITPQNISQFVWDFGDGRITTGGNSIVHTYRTAGKFNVQLIITDRNGCRDTLLKPLYIEVHGPTASFTTVNPAVCTNATVNFNDASVSDGLHPIQQWIWNYGDGVRDTLTAPPFQHTYANAGVFTVTLKVVDSKGCVDSMVRNGTVIISKPLPRFISADTTSCMGKPIRFINQSNSNTPSVYNWQFGDGNTSAVTNPVHNYVAEGFYTITLQVTDRYGCVDTFSRQQYIKIQNPRAIFAVSDSVATCPPLVVTFTNQSQNMNSWSWDFGDNTGSLSNSPVHFYTYPGRYRAKLRITSPGGCIDSAFQNIVVRGPEGTFTYDNIGGCVPVTVNFRGSTKDNALFTWDFGDGTVVETSDSIISHTYNRLGNYIPKMILTDPQGCRVPNPGPDTIKVFGVIAKFVTSKQLLCDSGLVNFTDSSQANEPITAYRWSFGDGTTSALRNPSHFYTSTGNYPIQLIVTSQRGCMDTVTMPLPLKIVQSPIIAMLGDTGKCTPAILQFGAQIIRNDTAALRWHWNFGNGDTSRLQNPLPVTFNTAGIYNIQLISTNSSGCADTVLRTVEAYPIPVVNAGADIVICRNNSTTLNASGAATYIWSPAGNLSCTNCTQPVATPLTDATYYVTGATQFGCINTDSVMVRVKQPFTITANLGDTLCLGESYTLEASGAELYQWSPVNGLTNDRAATTVAKPTVTTLYRVIGRDDNNCFFDTAFVPIVVYNFPVVNAGPDKTIAVGSNVQLQPQLSNDVSNLLWTPASGLSCTTCPNPIAAPKQTTTYNLRVINAGGCPSQDQLTIFVFCNNGNLFVPNTFSPNNDGSNDVFYPRGSGLFRVKTLRIFNRWGEVVFERQNFAANDATMGWNGTYKGQPASQDVYVYTIDIICENQTVLSYSGNVALIR